MKKQIEELAIKHELDKSKFVAALEEAFRLGLVDRTYRKPELAINVDEYRKIFSKDGKGKQGLKQHGLGDRNYISKKLQQWLIKNPQYTMDDVLNATRLYVNRFLDGEENVRFLVRADYFISKNGMSLLTSAVEEYVADKESLGTVKLHDSDNWDKEVV